MSCLYHGRTEGEVCEHLNRFKPSGKNFTDRSKAVLLLRFTISVIVCLCIYVLVK